MYVQQEVHIVLATHKRMSAHDYYRDLFAVLRTRNPSSLQFFIRSHATMFPVDMVCKVKHDVDLAELMMHKMILAIPTLSDLQEESKMWLIDRGYKPEL